MFTGIVTALGTVRAVRRTDDGLTLRVGAPYRGLRKGESVAVDGVCLTVERCGAGWFEVHAVETTLARTRIAGYGKGHRVNLERALKAGDRLGGHLVQGHVDGVGRVAAVARRGDAWLLDIEVPGAVARVAMPLGSITVDGVSLTIHGRPSPGVVQVSLIPFTFQQTTLGERRPGDAVHLEGDTIGKYVDHLLHGSPRDGRPADAGG